MAHYCSKGRGTRCNGRRATVPWDAFFEQSFFYCSLEVGSREYEKARKDQNCVVLDDGSVKAIKKIPRNYEVLLMGGHSEEHMGSVVHVRKWNVLQADSRIGRRRELICTKIASCSSVCRNCIHL